MSMSNYPNGFRYGLTVRNQPILSTHSGNIFWVGKTPEGQAGSNGYDGTYNWPFATIDFAIGKCAANHGDIIVVKAGHSETVIAAGGITVDVAGVSIIGLGSGGDRPAITFGTAVGASVAITADSVTIENIVGISGINLLTNPFHVTGSNCYLDIEYQDDGDTVEARTAVLASTVSNFNCIITYRGFITGDACYSAVQLVAVTGARIHVDAYGEFSVGIVNMLTTLSTDVLVTGYFYNDNVALTKNVVNTGGLVCTWYAYGYDGKGGYSFSGGSTTALAADDIGDLAAAVAVIDGYFDVPVANAAGNTTMRDVIGIKTDVAAAGAVSDVESLMAYCKQLVTEGIARDTAIGVIDGLFDVPVADAAGNATMRDVIGIKTDAAAAGAVSNVESIMAYAKQVVTELQVVDGIADGILADTIQISDATLNTNPVAASLATFIASGGTSLGTQLPVTCSLYDVLAGANGIPVFPAAAIPANAVSMAEVLREMYNQQEKAINTAAAVMSDALTVFTIAGGPILLLNLLSVCIVGNNATASLLSFNTDPTDGGATALTIASGSLANKAAGYMCSMTGTVGAATTETAVGAIAVTQALALIIPIGIITLTVAGGSTTGTWAHYLRYKPLGRGVVVTAAF